MVHTLAMKLHPALSGAQLPWGERKPAALPPRCRNAAAFTLMEILVAMALLSVIVLGLIAMFGQTQGAFKVGMAQTDITESGRSVMQMVAREFAEAVPSKSAVTNFSIRNSPFQALVQDLTGSTNSTPFRRTNFLQEVLFLIKQNKQWTAVGYRVGTQDAGFGSLYRLETNLAPSQLRAAWTIFDNTPITNFSHMADGVIHFRVRPYDTNGYPVPALVGLTNQQVFTVVSQPSRELDYYYTSNSLPYALGIEIGILPPRMVERVRALPDATTRRTYLSRAAQSGAVEMYQQRLTLPNVDPTAFP